MNSKQAFTLVLGVALAVLGLFAFLWSRGRGEPAPAEPPPPPEPVASSDLENTRRAVGVPYRIAQSLVVEGAMSAEEMKVLSADAWVTVHLAQVYVSTIREKTRETIVEERRIESSGFLVLSLEMTDNSIRQAVEFAERYGLKLVPGLYKVPALLAAELTRHFGDQAMERWMEGRSVEEVAELARQLGIEPDDSLARASRFPKSLQEMAGRTYVLTYRAGQAPEVQDEAGAPIPEEVRHFLERTSFFLDARFFEHRGDASFTYPAEALQQYFFTSFLPDAARVSVDGDLVARPSSRPVTLPGVEPMTEFQLEGTIDASVPGEGTSRVHLALDPRRSKALLGNESGYLREVDLRGTGDFAHHALFSILGVDVAASRRAEGEASITARQRCAPDQ